MRVDGVGRRVQGVSRIEATRNDTKKDAKNFRDELRDAAKRNNGNGQKRTKGFDNFISTENER